MAAAASNIGMTHFRLIRTMALLSWADTSLQNWHSAQPSFSMRRAVF
jgi:hypothetical protein